MELDYSGELDIEVDGEPVHLLASGGTFELSLSQLSTVATLARAFPKFGAKSSKYSAMRQAMAFCERIIIKLDDRVMMKIERHPKYKAAASGKQAIFAKPKIKMQFFHKRLWIKNSYPLLKSYFRNNSG